MERIEGGFFVTLEGPDGSGKSTQAERLGAALEAAGIACLVTREPGGTALGERVRKIVLDARELKTTPAVEALLFNAARAQHAAEVIRPALARGTVVVCDRFSDSTLAYQGAGYGESIDDLRAVQHLAIGNLRPALTILIDVSVEEGIRRKRRDDEMNRFEADRDAAYHQRVRDAFLAMAAAEPARFVVVDGSQPFESVTRAILEAVRDRLGPRVGVGATERLQFGRPSEPPAAPARMN